MARRKKLTILANIFHSKQQRVRDTSADHNRLRDQPWSFKGTYRAPKMDLIIFKQICFS